MAQSASRTKFDRLRDLQGAVIILWPARPHPLLGQCSLCLSMEQGATSIEAKQPVANRLAPRNAWTPLVEGGRLLHRRKGNAGLLSASRRVHRACRSSEKTQKRAGRGVVHGSDVEATAASDA